MIFLTNFKTLILKSKPSVLVLNTTASWYNYESCLARGSLYNDILYAQIWHHSIFYCFFVVILFESNISQLYFFILFYFTEFKTFYIDPYIFLHHGQCTFLPHLFQHSSSSFINIRFSFFFQHTIPFSMTRKMKTKP